jgi:hypothetical protein
MMNDGRAFSLRPTLEGVDFDYTEHINDEINRGARRVLAAIDAGIEEKTLPALLEHLRDRGYRIVEPADGGIAAETRTEYRARYTMPNMPTGAAYEMSGWAASKKLARSLDYNLRRSEESLAGIIGWETREVILGHSIEEPPEAKPELAFQLGDLVRLCGMHWATAPGENWVDLRVNLTWVSPDGLNGTFRRDGFPWTVSANPKSALYAKVQQRATIA